MYNELINLKIDKTKQDFADFPEFLNGKVLVGYENGFIVEDEQIVPQSITMRQCRLQLISMGLDDEVEMAIEAIADPTQKKIVRTEWEYAATVDRYNGWIETLVGALGMSVEQLDGMFVQASAL